MTKRKRGRTVKGLFLPTKAPYRYLPHPPTEPLEIRSFDEIIGAREAERKREYPHNTLIIDRLVADLKQKYKSGVIFDWYDTWNEFDRAAMQSLGKPLVSRKPANRKR